MKDIAFEPIEWTYALHDKDLAISTHRLCERMA